MALATYDDLKASVEKWMARADLAGDAADFIMLGEAHLKREIPTVETGEEFALSDTSPTNWLLTNHPDVYLAATLMWGGVFTQDSAFGQVFSAILDRGIPSVKSVIAESKKGLLTVDPALAGRRARYDGINDI